MTFRILFVCTGNICRSPFAEILTRHLLIGRLGGHGAARFEVSSAGVRAVVGAGMDPGSRAELAPWKLDGAAADPFRARLLRTSMIEDADLVLGAGIEHRSAVVERVPAALATAFGLRELARLVAGIDAASMPADPVDRARELVTRARLRRGSAAPVGRDEDSIPDPMGLGPRAHHASAELIGTAVRVIVDGIAPRTGGRRAPV